MKKLWMALVAVVVIVVGAFIVLVIMDDEPADNTTITNTSASTSNTSNSTNSSGGSTNEDETDTGITIIYTNSGFNPKEYSVVSGSKVTVENNSTSTLEFASDNHPTHEDNSELNIGEIAPGESKTFTPDTEGTWGFHNHERDAHSGTLVVK